MRIGILPIGQIDAGLLARLQRVLSLIFSEISFVVIEPINLSEKAFDKRRNQYSSSLILRGVSVYAVEHMDLTRVLGVVDADIFVPELNFVFGEAAFPGKSALISLWRLKSEFYGDVSDSEHLFQRALKEAVHELGHTFGLKHCPQVSCVMHFSNSLIDTDKKQSLFCNLCHLQLDSMLNG
jgi:archaemetzincin